MDKRHSHSGNGNNTIRRPGFVAALVYVFEQVMPDPFVLSIGLTLVVSLLALVFSPHNSLATILASWYEGTFSILGFALQMILILATGYAIADAPLVQRGLRAMAAGAATPTRAALLVFPIVAIAAWLNWGLGLIVGALLSREIAKRVKVVFAWLVAGSYSAWSVCNSGLSSSIALSQASHGNALNLAEKATGQVIPLSETVFAPFVFIPTVLVVLVMTAIFIWMHPKPEQVVVFKETRTEVEEADPHARGTAPSSFAARAEQSILGTLFLLALGVGYLAVAENVSNMLQPFWAVPVVAIAGIRIQRVMGYTAITFVVSLVIYATALWLIS